MKIKNIFLILVLLLFANCAMATVAVTGVTLNKTTLSLFKGNYEMLVATVSPTNATNKSLIWSSNKTYIANVNSYGKVTALDTGTCTITVTTVDGSMTASYQVTITIPVTGITLNKTSLSLNNRKGSLYEVGSYETLVATVNPSDATNKNVIWSSSNTSIAAVSSSGLVVSVGDGDCIITVKTVDGSKAATCQVHVYTVPVTGVTLNKTSLTLNKGAYEKLVATISPTDVTDNSVTWYSSNSSIATVGSNGEVLAVNAGTCKITVKTVDGSKTASCQVNVIYIPVSGVSLNKATLSVCKGLNELLVATSLPSDASIKSLSWSSSNTSVATVRSDGLVIGVANGDCTITVSTVDGGFTATCQVNVYSIPVTEISLNITNLTLTKGYHKVLLASILPSNATNKKITWSSSDISVAKVDSSGEVTSVANGDCIITVTTVDGGFTASCQVSVITLSVTGVALNKTSLTLLNGTYETLVATLSPSNPTIHSVIWSSSNTSIATVNSYGNVHAMNPGTCTITVTTVEFGFTANCQVTVPVPVTGVTLNKTTLSLLKNNSETLAATIFPSDAENKSVIWSSSNTSVATVDSSGNVTAVGNGECEITVSTVYGGKTAKCWVSVYSFPITGVSLNKATLSLNKTAQEKLNPIIQPGNSEMKAVIWSSSDNTIATVDNNGLVTALEIGKCIVTVTTLQGGFTATCAVNIEKEITEDNISETVTPGWAYKTAIKDNFAFLADGDDLLLFEISNPASPLKISEFVTLGDVCSVDVSGDFAYLASWGAGLEIIDISDTANPVKVGAYTTTGKACDVAVFGNFAYVADTEIGLEILNISNPANPVRVGGYNNNGYLCAVAVSGNYAYVTDYSSGLVIIDISNPSNPQKVGEYTTVGAASGITIVDNYLYLADSDSGLNIFDVTNPFNPLKIGEFDYIGFAYDVAIVGKYAYVADFDKSLVIFDISNPAIPQMVARYNITGNGNSVSLVGNYIYISEGDVGLGVIGVGYQIAGNVSLGTYYGDLTNVDIRFGLMEDGSQLWNTPINLDGFGNFAVPYILPGNYDLSIKGSHWLRRVVSGIIIEENSTIIDFTLINGDVVENNEVDFADINAVRAAYGSFPGDLTWNERADVDGNGEVDFTDINIVRGNCGAVGE